MQKIFSSWKKGRKVGQPMRLSSQEANGYPREVPKAAVALAVATTTTRETASHPLRQPIA
jgi:hypothetical protein